jgi:hypothetical protein
MKRKRNDIVPPMRSSGSIFGKGSITRSSSDDMPVVLPAASCVGTKPRQRLSPFRVWVPVAAIAFSSEADTGPREENASKQESGASVLIQSEPIMLLVAGIVARGLMVVPKQASAPDAQPEACAASHAESRTF